VTLASAAYHPIEAYAVKRPLGRVWAYTALSLGLYSYAWFHTHRQLLDGELGQGRDDATLHTLGLLVPVLNFFIIHWLWRDLNALRARFGLQEFPEIAYLVGSIFLAPVFFSLVVNQLNEYWDVRTHGLATDADVNSFEKASLVIGGCLLALWVLTLVVAIVVVVLSATG
jgi:hypothetical protein